MAGKASSNILHETILGVKNAASSQEQALFEKTQKYVRYIAWIPGLQMVAVCNSLSMFAVNDDSDIDLFIVSSPKRMWLVRVLVTAVFHILGVRRHGKHTVGRFCLSFFCTSEVLDLKKIAIENDIYLQLWIKHLKPIYDIGSCYAEFLRVNSYWVEVTEAERERNRMFLNGGANDVGISAHDKNADTHIKKISTWEKFLDRADSLLRTIFEPVTLREYARLNKPWGIIINENMLKFHKNDARKEIRDGLTKD